MRNRRYPKIFIRSKSELAKRISHNKFPHQEALKLINDAIQNFDNYWRHSKRSEPKKDKYVRDAKGTPLGLLLNKIDAMLLSPHDKMLPNFIFGGIKGMNHAMAAKHLLGHKRRRTLLKLDIKHFFEQISEDRVAQFFHKKCNCSKKAARLISRICCVPLGPKGSNNKKTIARGFATSPRLAVWCNLDAFIKLDRLAKKYLKGKDPRIMIYVDDIGITATHVTPAEMEYLYKEIDQLLKSDQNQILELHPLGEKSKILSHEQGMRILGVELRRNTLALGGKTKSKIETVKNKLKKNLQPKERDRYKQKRTALAYYKNYVVNL